MEKTKISNDSLNVVDGKVENPTSDPVKLPPLEVVVENLGFWFMAFFQYSDAMRAATVAKLKQDVVPTSSDDKE